MFDRSCPILERAGDGYIVGRCWYHVGVECVCPRHGLVTEAMERYNKVHELTDDNTHVRVFPKRVAKVTISAPSLWERFVRKFHG